MKKGANSQLNKDILDKLDQIIEKVNHLLRLQASALGNIQPSDDCRRRIDELRGLSATLYNFLNISRTREEISELVKKNIPQQKNVPQYVYEYTGSLRDRNLIIEIAMGKQEYVVRRFAYDAPMVKSKSTPKEEQQAKDKLEVDSAPPSSETSSSGI